MEPLNDSRSPVLLYEHAADNGRVIAEARLNSEGALNSLSLEMIGLLSPALSRWAQRKEVVALLITGSGERAFCAGGDIQALYYAMLNNHQSGEAVDEYPYQFFEHEYRLDYQLHNYPKPVIAVGHGIVMGGGLGVFSGAAIRVVTERSRMAMPEINIGLFPDAGATWLLRNLAPHRAAFLGMTGSHINARDALTIGIGTHCVADADRESVREVLLAVDWQGDSGSDQKAVEQVMAGMPAVEFPKGEIDAVPETLDVSGSLLDVTRNIEALRGCSNWIDRGISNLQNGCPTSIGIVVEQLKRARSMSLPETFRLEMTVATHCAENADFAEGVRALIIEKNNKPRWQFDDLASLPASYVESHFVEPWSRNPLHDLEVQR